MTNDQICESCGADFSIEAFKAAGLIPLDKGSAYGEKGCPKCADTPLKRLVVCEEYINAGMVEDMEPEDRDKFQKKLRKAYEKPDRCSRFSEARRCRASVPARSAQFLVPIFSGQTFQISSLVP